VRRTTAEGSQGARGDAGSGDAGSLEAELRGQGDEGRNSGRQQREQVTREAGAGGSRRVAADTLKSS
jgi:hypothetical protein